MQVEAKIRERKRLQKVTDTLVEAVKKNRDVDEWIDQGANARIACLQLQLFHFELEEEDDQGRTALVREFTDHPITHARVKVLLHARADVTAAHPVSCVTAVHRAAIEGALYSCINRGCHVFIHHSRA
jgi:hypothetical protein